MDDYVTITWHEKKEIERKKGARGRREVLEKVKRPTTRVGSSPDRKTCDVKRAHSTTRFHRKPRSKKTGER